MKYWVYINEEVLPQPYEAGELYTIKGFDGQTLICPEDVPEGEEQQWYTADELINYSASRPKNLAEAVAAVSEQDGGEIPVEQEQPQAEELPQTQEEPSYMPTDEQEVYDATEDYNPEPLPDSYGKEYTSASVQDNALNTILLEKIELLLSQVSGLKENIIALNEKTSELAQKVEKVETGKNNAPIVKDYAALKAFKNQTSAPLNENEIPEEQLSVEESDEEKMPIITADPEDILESALENTMRLKAVSDVVAPVALDLTSKETIQIKEDEDPKPAEENPEEKPEEKTEEKPEDPVQEEKPEVKQETPTQEAVEQEPAVQQETISEEEPAQEEPAQEEENLPAQEDFESVKIAPVGTEEEEEILKTFAQEKEDEQKEEAIKEEEVAALEQSVGVESIAEPIQETSEEPAFEQIEAPAEQQAAEEFPAEEQQQEEEPVPADNQEQYFEPSQEEQQAPVEEDALAALTTPPNAAEPSQETSEVDAVDDKFLKTFSSSIDEISLDQPTSIISDYVPPAVTSDSPLYDEDADSKPKVQGMEDLKNQSVVQEDVRQVKRIKPAAIKTVPMVASGNPIGIEENPTNIEEAVTELKQTSTFVKGIKAFALIAVLLFVVLGFVYVLAFMGIIPNKYSPIHNILDKITGPKVEETPDLQETTPVPVSANEANETDDTAADSDDVINAVKNYAFADGSTLETKINALHGEDPDNIQWTAEPSVNPPYYQVVITLPPNREGYNVTYRFNYDTENKELIPTTSESNNIMSMSIPSSSRKK